MGGPYVPPMVAGCRDVTSDTVSFIPSDGMNA